ncbi:MAG: MarR family winged helix-turn-helix transcriptional regulator [Solirubrobacteraceae bacterium]
MQATVIPDSALAQRLGVFVGYVMQTCGRDVVQLASEFELSFSQMKAIQKMREAAEPVSVKTLGDQLGLSLAAMSRAADDLVQRGLVDRVEDPDDRRIKRLSLTPAGNELVQKLIESRLAGVGEFVDSLSPKERALLDKALQAIVAREDLAAYAEVMRRA